MSRHPDSGHLHLPEVFHRAQLELQAQLALTRLIEHPSTSGTACERHWLDTLNDYLPHRYQASPAFIINAHGQRSRQIDIAIFDRLQATPLFPNSAAPHINIESVQAVFEVKPTVSRQWLRDAGEKAASVRALAPYPHKSRILAGLLASTSVWTPATFEPNLTRALTSLPSTHQINLGTALNHGSFDHEPTKVGPARAGKRNSDRLMISPPDKSLMFLILRLITNLNTQPPTRIPNLLHYLDPTK